MPRKTKIDRATNGDQARHQTQPSAVSATPAMQNEGWCHQAPLLPRKSSVDVARRHPCQRHGIAGDQARNQTHLSRKVPRHHGRPRAPPDPAECHKCHACQGKGRLMSPSAASVTQKQLGCRQVPRLPRSARASRATNTATKRATRFRRVP